MGAGAALVEAAGADGEAGAEVNASSICSEVQKGEAAADEARWFEQEELDAEKAERQTCEWLATPFS